MDSESGLCTPKAKIQKLSMSTFWLAYQSLGVVYGDLAISPIFVYTSTFSEKRSLSEDDTEIYGVLSLVFWTIILIAGFKYIIIVLEADDKGEGGIFALYSRLCRNSKFGLINTSNAAYEQMPLNELQAPCELNKSNLLIKRFFENHQKSRLVLFFVVLLGSSMFIGDGILMPTMSVLSAVSGLSVKMPALNEKYTLVISCFILAGLFALQHFGTHRVGFLFAPVLICWLGCISLIGIYNISKWNRSIIYALSPYNIYKYFKAFGKGGLSSLRGVVLCITGAEAMYTDLGHFSKLSLRIAFSTLVLPSLLLAYMGEAAFLSVHREDLHMSFYRSIPESIFWPVYIITTLATVAASQASISATFSIISQCTAFNCFPRVKIIRTSNHVFGQIYIPEINWLLMLLCLLIAISFKNTRMIGNAYGLAVITVMFVTTCLMFLIITSVWNKSILLATLFIVIFGSVELFYISACLAKFLHGGWLPFAISLIFFSVMATWHYGTSKKQDYELQNKVHLDSILNFKTNIGLARVPGIALIISSSPDFIPPIFAHFVTNFPVLHRIVIFVSMQTVAVQPRIPLENRFLITRIAGKDCDIFGCIVRYGYKDARVEVYKFEDQLLNRVELFLLHEGSDNVAEGTTSTINCSSDWSLNDDDSLRMEKAEKLALKERLADLLEQREAGVVYMMGHTCLQAHSSSSFLKKIAINFVFEFLWRNCRRPAVALGIPQAPLIEVGIVYQV